MTTLFSIFALRGRDRDNPSVRGRSNDNYEQRMELIEGGADLHDNLCRKGQLGFGNLRKEQPKMTIDNELRARILARTAEIRDALAKMTGSKARRTMRAVKEIEEAVE